MRLNKLSLKDKKIIHEFLGIRQHELSTYTFENIYIWKGLFDIRWTIIKQSLCIFFKDNLGCFLYIPPLSRTRSQEVVKKVFKILNKFNQNQEVSRIENIEQQDSGFYKGLGYNLRLKSYDYLCLRDDLINLRGNKFKSKRSSYNYFIKHNDFEYLPFSLKNRFDALHLYDYWMKVRSIKFDNSIYRYMLRDSRNSLKVALDGYFQLNLKGGIVKIGGETKAFTLGFELNKNTFCILFEISDLSIKGLAQFIFARFCRELKDYKYINIMDDLGLDNLKQVKLSYRPIKLIPSYTSSAVLSPKAEAFSAPKLRVSPRRCIP